MNAVATFLLVVHLVLVKRTEATPVGGSDVAINTSSFERLNCAVDVIEIIPWNETLTNETSANNLTEADGGETMLDHNAQGTKNETVIDNIDDCGGFSFDGGNVTGVASAATRTIDAGISNATDLACVGNYSTLKDSLEGASDGDHISLCPGTISVLGEVRVRANRIGVGCAGDPGSCILAKERGPNSTGRILNFRGDGLELRGIQFWDASCGGSGGAVKVVTEGGFMPVIVEDCRFVGNRSGRNGGALHIGRHGCHVALRNTSFTNNSARRNGGGVSLERAHDGPTCRIPCYSVRSLVLSNNTARHHGGAVYTNFWLCGENFARFNEAGKTCDDVGLKTENGVACTCT